MNIAQTVLSVVLLTGSIGGAAVAVRRFGMGTAGLVSLAGFFWIALAALAAFFLAAVVPIVFFLLGVALVGVGFAMPTAVALPKQASQREAPVLEASAERSGFAVEPKFLMGAIAGALIIGILAAILAVQRGVPTDPKPPIFAGNDPPKGKEQPAPLPDGPVSKPMPPTSKDDSPPPPKQEPPKQQPARLADFGFQVAGTIVELPVKVGDEIRKGQLLARLESRAAEQEAKLRQAQIEQARAELAGAAKALAAAESDFARADQLYRQTVVSRQDHDLAKSAVETGRANVKAHSERVKLAETQTLLAQHRVVMHQLVSDCDGIVAAINKRVGEGIRAVPDEMLLRMRPLGAPDPAVVDPQALRVPSRRAGVVTAVVARVGDRVTRGQTLVRFDDRLVAVEVAVKKAQIGQCQAEEQKAKAKREQALMTYQRAIQLASKDVISRRELDEATAERDKTEAAFKSATLAIKVAESVYEAARNDLESCTVTSPVAGFVVQVSCVPGEAVRAQATLLSIREQP